MKNIYKIGDWVTYNKRDCEYTMQIVNIDSNGWLLGYWFENHKLSTKMNGHKYTEYRGATNKEILQARGEINKYYEVYS